jgi:hypothetical protein
MYTFQCKLASTENNKRILNEIVVSDSTKYSPSNVTGRKTIASTEAHII